MFTAVWRFVPLLVNMQNQEVNFVSWKKISLKKVPFSFLRGDNRYKVSSWGFYVFIDGKWNVENDRSFWRFVKGTFTNEYLSYNLIHILPGQFHYNDNAIQWSTNINRYVLNWSRPWTYTKHIGIGFVTLKKNWYTIKWPLTSWNLKKWKNSTAQKKNLKFHLIKPHS